MSGRRRVLVLEEFAPMLDALLEALREAGYDADACVDTAEAVRAIQSGRYDLVVTEHHIAGLTSFDVLELAQLKTPGTPVIVLAGSETAHFTPRIHAGGAFAVLRKPVQLDVLIDRLRQALT